MPRNTTLLHTIIVTILVSLSGTVAAAENSIQSQPTAVSFESAKPDFCTTLKTSKPPQKQPNILFILLDNIGKDWFRCYGSQENVTPNIVRAGTRIMTQQFMVAAISIGTVKFLSRGSSRMLATKHLYPENGKSTTSSIPLKKMRSLNMDLTNTASFPKAKKDTPLIKNVIGIPILSKMEHG